MGFSGDWRDSRLAVAGLGALCVAGVMLGFLLGDFSAVVKVLTTVCALLLLGLLALWVRRGHVAGRHRTGA